MNNLLRTLTEYKSKPVPADVDLKLLLASVHNARAHDTRISDPFYESLEGVLLDLRTTTIDNHDAEAFLKPVLKSEVADYYDVIKSPMDLQTMLKRVKAKHYKSKAEFKTDLELIWSNCLTYNAVETHPLRQCAMRLRVRANRLLANITDRKERQDPRIPAALAGTPTDVRISQVKPNNISSNATTVNGSAPTVNGVNGIHQRPPTITIKPRKSLSGEIPQRRLSLTAAGGIKREGSSRTLGSQKVAFENMPALVRTAEGMRAFAAADERMEWDLDVLTPYLPQDRNNCQPWSDEVKVKTEDVEAEAIDVDAMVGDKRRWNETDALGRPRKRSRQDVDPNLWWTAVQSDALLANGLPHIPYASSKPTPQFFSFRSKLKAESKDKKDKRKAEEAAGEKTLLARMNNNLRTQRRMRHTHARFAALGLGTSGGGPAGPDEEQPGGMLPPPLPPPPPLAPIDAPGHDDDAVVVGENEIDDRPWGAEVGIGLTPKQWRKRRRKQKARALAMGNAIDLEDELDSVEIGSENAEQCMRWTGSKLLEHSGFQGTSKAALDVLASVTSEYLLNVGRTMRYLTDKYAKTMTPEEIILHTLFESGVSHVHELERYIRDEVERHGSRLGDMEKKLVGAYNAATVGEIIDDETLFEEDEENDGALTLGDFAEALGEDYLGLRELGIAAEFGMSNLSIPKKLLRRRRAMGAGAGPQAAPAPPPLPYPLPPPFVPLIRAKVEEQIGLLQSFYLGKFTALAEATATAAAAASASATLPPLAGPRLPPLPGPSLPGLPPLPGPSFPAPPVAPSLPSAPLSEPATATPEEPPEPTPRLPVHVPPAMILPDDPATGIHTKMGPLGQILLPGAKAAVASTKKKVEKDKDKDKDKDKQKDKDKDKPKDKDGGEKKKSKASKKQSNGGGGNKSDAALMPPPPLPMPIVAGV
ncbi:SAGA complex protein [Mycena amicta]|nr:SAGA complex protein [Mycena amicta]